MTKRSFTRKGLSTKISLELEHSNLCGPMNVKAQGRFEYFINFVDDHSRFDHVYLLHHKCDSLEKFIEYNTKVENQLEKTIKKLRAD